MLNTVLLLIGDGRLGTVDFKRRGTRRVKISIRGEGVVILVTNSVLANTTMTMSKAVKFINLIVPRLAELL